MLALYVYELVMKQPPTAYFWSSNSTNDRLPFAIVLVEWILISLVYQPYLLPTVPKFVFGVSDDGKPLCQKSHIVNISQNIGEQKLTLYTTKS